MEIDKYKILTILVRYLYPMVFAYIISPMITFMGPFYTFGQIMPSYILYQFSDHKISVIILIFSIIPMGLYYVYSFLEKGNLAFFQIGFALIMGILMYIEKNLQIGFVLLALNVSISIIIDLKMMFTKNIKKNQ